MLPASPGTRPGARVALPPRLPAPGGTEGGRTVLQGRAVVASMHDLGMAARWCDRLVLMDRGRLVADGAPPEVLTAPHLRDSFGVGGAFVATPAGPAFVTLPL